MRPWWTCPTRCRDCHDRRGRWTVRAGRWRSTMGFSLDMTWVFMHQLAVDAEVAGTSPAFKIPTWEWTPYLAQELLVADWCSVRMPSKIGVFIAVLFVISRTWKQPRCPSTEEWIKKMWHIYTLEYYSAIKNNDILKSKWKWMELEKTILSEITQTQKDEHGMYSLISGH